MPRENRRNLPIVDYNEANIRALQAQLVNRPRRRRRMPSPRRDLEEEPPRQRQNRGELELVSGKFWPYII